MNISTIDRTGLGATDAAPALGLSRYKTALQLWLEKTGRSDGAREENRAMSWGKKLQSVILGEFLERTGKRLLSEEARLRHPEHQWLFCTVDAELDGNELAEVKTAGPWSADEWGEPGTDEIPVEYVVQCCHQMAVSGANLVHVPVLIGGQDFRIYQVQRNDGLIRDLIANEKEFWTNYVCASRQPDPDWSHQTTPKLMEWLYPPSEGKRIELADEALVLAEEYRTCGERSRAFDEARAKAKAQLIALMQDAAEGVLPDGEIVRRKNCQRKAYTVAETTYVDFRILKPKGAKV